MSFETATSYLDIGNYGSKILRYISAHRELTMTILEEHQDVNNLYYAQAFAPYANKIKIYYAPSLRQNNHHEQLLHTIIT
jgi:hypothetical protein